MSDPRSPWHSSHRFDPRARAIADRHYNRQTIGAPQFVPPGRCTVLYTTGAFWVTSWPFAEFTRHRWAGAWVCSAFRREPACAVRASVLIRLAIAHTRHVVGGFPIVWTPTRLVSMVTFVNPAKVAHKRDPGRCFLRAGFKRDGETEGGLLAFVLEPQDVPAPMPVGDDLFGAEAA